MDLLEEKQLSGLNSGGQHCSAWPWAAKPMFCTTFELLLEERRYTIVFPLVTKDKRKVRTQENECYVYSLKFMNAF